MKATLTVTGSADGLKIGTVKLDTTIPLPLPGQPITAALYKPPFAIFAMKDNVILAAPIEAPGVFHHSSLFSGQPVQCAGTIKTDATGKLLDLTNDSGHYKPAAPCLFNVLKKLRSDGYTGDAKITDMSSGSAVNVEIPAWVTA